MRFMDSTEISTPMFLMGTQRTHSEFVDEFHMMGDEMESKRPRGFYNSVMPNDRSRRVHGRDKNQKSEKNSIDNSERLVDVIATQSVINVGHPHASLPFSQDI